MLAYRIDLEPDTNDTLLVTCPALPEVVTFGEDEEGAKRHAVDAIEEAIAGRIADGADVPVEDPGDDPSSVRLPLLSALKVLLYRELRRLGVTRAELARRLGWHRESVDRLFRLDHASRPEQIEAAFEALGRRIDVQVREHA